MKQSNISSLIKLLFGWPLGLIAVYFIYTVVAPKESVLFASLFHLHFWLLFYGMCSLIAYFFIRAYLWYTIVREYKQTLSFRETAYGWAMAELKRYIPGSILAIASRLVHFSEKGITKKDIGKAYVKEALLIVMGSFFVSLLSLPLVLQHIFSFPNAQQCILVCSVIGLFGYLFLSAKNIKGNFGHFVSLFIFDETIDKKLVLLGLSCVAFFFFGLGSVLIVFSFVTFDLQLFYILLGFFTFTYLIGYLSFITPSGIGVREGLIVYGLQSYITTSTAGFVALFSRVLLIIAELLFLGIVIIWEKVKWFSRIEKVIAKDPYLWSIFLLIIIYSIYFTVTSFARYDNFYTGRFDLGNMAQTVWNTSHGRIFQLTDPNGTFDVTRLATHADFLLILLAPFYWIWSDPRMLLIIQTIVLSLGAVYVYLLAIKICKHKLLAFTFVVMYLLNPSIERTNIYDFHAVTLATTFLLAAFYYLIGKRYRWFLIFALLAGVTKEQVWIIVGLFGLYIAFFHKKIIFGISLLILSWGFFYYLVSYAIPQALGTQHFALSYYSDFGDTPGGVIKNIIREPAKVIALMFGPEQRHFLQQIFSSVGYLALLSPLYILFSSSELLISLLSSNPNLHQIYYQYTATITPFLFIAAIYGVANVQRFFPKLPLYVLVVYILGASFVTAYLYGPLPGSLDPNTDMFSHPLSNRVAIDHFLQTIPKRYSVASTNNLGSHLSHRQNIYTVPVGLDKADVIAFLMTDPGAQPSVAFQQNLIDKLRNDQTYVIWKEEGPFIVFRRKIVPSRPTVRKKA